MCAGQIYDYELSDGRFLLRIFLAPGVDDGVGVLFATMPALGCEVEGCRWTPFTFELAEVGWCMPLTLDGATSGVLGPTACFEETGNSRLVLHHWIAHQNERPNLLSAGRVSRTGPSPFDPPVAPD